MKLFYYCKRLSVPSTLLLAFSFHSAAQTDSVYYHHGTFESQYGSSGGFPSYDYNKYVTRFTPPYYPAQLVGIKAWFRNAGDPSSFKCVAFKDTTAAANGPVSSTPDYISPVEITNPASGGVADSSYSQYVDITAANIEITKGDVYAGVTQHPISNGFLGMAIDTSNAYTTDRPWTYFGIWEKMLSYTGINGEWGITAYFIPVTTGVEGSNEQETLRVYPNPVSETAMIMYHVYNNSPLTLKVFNADGSEVIKSFQLSSFNRSFILETAGLTTGVYFICASGDEGTRVTKFVKE